MEQEQTNENVEQGRGMNPMLIGGLLLLVIAGVVVFSTLSRGNGAEQTPENTAPTAQNNTVGSESTNEGALGMTNPPTETSGDVDVTVNVEAGSYYFNPEEIRVNQGDRVRIVLNAVDMMHNLVIDEFDVESEIVSEGESTVIEFTADIAGEFEYYCNVGNHRAMGQVGTLIVE